MADIDVRADVGVLEALEFQPECQSKAHTSSAKHGGDAAYLQIGECEHATGLRCLPYVEAVLQENADLGGHASIRCSDCGHSMRARDLRFIPIGTP